LVAAVFRTACAGEFQFWKLGDEYSAQSRLLFAVACFCAITSKSGSTIQATTQAIDLGNRASLGDCRSYSRIAAALYHAVNRPVCLAVRGDVERRICELATMARRPIFSTERSTTRCCRDRSSHLCLSVHLRVGNCSPFARTAKSETDLRADRSCCSRIGATLCGRSRLSAIPLLCSSRDRL